MFLFVLLGNTPIHAVTTGIISGSSTIRANQGSGRVWACGSNSYTGNLKSWRVFLDFSVSNCRYTYRVSESSKTVSVGNGAFDMGSTSESQRITINYYAKDTYTTTDYYEYRSR